MNNPLLKYLNGEVNVYKGLIILGREKLSAGSEHITLSDADEPITIYSFWNNTKKRVNGDGPPKHTGGKKSYVKMYSEWLDQHPEASIEVIGTMTRLSRNIEWSTGHLVHTRSKKRLQILDICKLINKSNKTTISILKEAKQLNLIAHSKDGYKVNANFMCKGVSK
jgi:hypothetical protein